MGRFRTVRFPVNFDGEHASEVRPPPTLGEDNEAIRAAAGRIWRARRELSEAAAE